jgi:lipopolysaccharide/colanic/teichoic acid biosynthesis glycosyltransferase
MTTGEAAWGNSPHRATKEHTATGGARWKRTLDLVGAVALLVIVSPLLVLSVLAVRLSSPGPVLFHQVRLGLHGRPFVMFKLRTMRSDATDAVHRAYVQRMLAGEARPQDGLYKLGHDDRVTRVGAVLRRCSLDELPQLWNVVRGDMSLVGPRPVLPWEAELFPDWADARFDVQPGVTGLWQVSGRNRLTMTEGLVLDVRYVTSRSLALDLLILLRTVGAVLGRGGR